MWVGGVRAVILNEKDELLMVCQHHENRDIWMVPGGAIEKGETAKDAAIRETLEETGLKIDVEELIWHIEQITEKGKQRFVNYFRANICEGELLLGKDPEFDDEHQVLRDVKFISKDEICKLENVFPEYLKTELWEYINENYKNYSIYKIRK